MMAYLEVEVNDEAQWVVPDMKYAYLTRTYV